MVEKLFGMVLDMMPRHLLHEFEDRCIVAKGEHWSVVNILAQEITRPVDARFLV